LLQTQINVLPSARLPSVFHAHADESQAAAQSKEERGRWQNMAVTACRYMFQAINLHPTDDEWVAMRMQNGEGTTDSNS